MIRFSTLLIYALVLRRLGELTYIHATRQDEAAEKMGGFMMQSKNRAIGTVRAPDMKSGALVSVPSFSHMAQVVDPAVPQEKAVKIHRFSPLSGAGNVTRTHDLLITKCVQSAQTPLSGTLGRFSLGMKLRLSLFVPLFPYRFFLLWVRKWVKPINK